jgi:PAS domain S-box-containing protein
MSTPSTPRPPSAVERQAFLSASLIIVVVATLLVVALLGFETLSSARAYVGGEGHWSKAQKEAAYHLVRYLHNQEPAEYAAFTEQLDVIAGDREARLEILAERPDRERIRDGLRRGRIHPDDIAGMATFLRRFRAVDFVAQGIRIWEEGDSLIAELEKIGEGIRAEAEAGALTPARQEAHLATLHALTRELNQLEDAFSATMGAGARWATGVLQAILVAVALLLLGTATLMLWTGHRRGVAFEQSLREKEGRYRTLVEGAPFGIARSTIDGRILAANPALVRMLGYGSEEALREVGFAQKFYRNPEDRIRLIVEPVLRGEVIREVELEVLRRDGSCIQVRANGRVLRGPDGKADSFEVFLEDITGERELEAQLRQAQKMEAVGQLTGGIAHDFNNILTIILSTARLIEQGLPPGLEGVRADLADLRLAADRGAEMIRKLLAFSRPEQLRFEVHQLDTLLEEAGTMLARMLPASIQLELDLGTDVPLVRADPALLEQMLFNLATNARDAMPGGGRLTLALGSAEIDEAFVQARGWGRPGSYGTLRVEDTGEGMSASALAGAFVPFFTTKPPGQGTGLGLPMVYGLMKQHGGFVDLTSTLGRGTAVTLYFPATEPEPLAAAAVAHAAPAGSGTVLIVEDEPVLRRAAERILRANGFTVLSAGDGQEALACFREHRRKIGLVLSDVVMPRLGGPGLYAAIRGAGEQVPFLFMSGYPARDLPEGIPLPEDVPLLAKPWEAEELVEWVRHALAGNGHPGPSRRGAGT